MSTRNQQKERGAARRWTSRWVRVGVPLLFALPLVILALARAAGRAEAAEPTPVTVYKSPTCGCCGKWIDHLKEHGFAVTVRDVANVQAVKTEHGVPQALASCHTSLAGGYALEGHVPADVIRRLLRERPAVAGIAVPGMPSAAPGMGDEGPPYDVIAFTRDGATSVYARK